MMDMKTLNSRIDHDLGLEPLSSKSKHEEDISNGLVNRVLKEDCENERVDFDDLLPLIGEFGRYQKQLLLYIIPFNFFLVFVYFAQIFITLVPDNYWCRVPELSSLSVELRWFLELGSAYFIWCLI